jgi:integrase
MPIGLVRKFPKDKDAWRQADRLGLSVRINDGPVPGRIRFDFLAAYYLRADFGADAVRPKSANTISHVEHIVRAYLVPRFGNEIAEDIKPLDIQQWFKSLHETGGLAWTTIAKMRGVISRIYRVGILHEHVANNPVLHVETRSKTDYNAIVITPEQTLAILKSLPSPLLFTSRWCSPAPTRRSALRRCWRCAGRSYCGRKDGFGFRSAGQTARMGETKTESSNGYVP